MASDKEVKEFVSKGLNAEDQRLRAAIVAFMLVLLLLLLASASKVQAGGQPTLTVKGTRARLDLSLSQQPAANQLRYYVDGSGELTQTVSWIEVSGNWTTVVTDTRGWTAFKVYSETEGYVPNVISPFWVDDPNEESGWLQRSVFTPTLQVSGNYSATLTAWGIWGDEPVEYWQLGQHIVLTDTQWTNVTTDTYRLVLSNTRNLASLKVETWPDLQLTGNSPYWVAGSNAGWVVHITLPWRLFLPALFR